MSRSPDRLYNLLPAIYRLRDAEQGASLQALLRVITEQVDVIEDDIAQLYENWFIETCQDWVVPYIGDLIGYLPVSEAGPPAGGASQREQARNRALIPRREVGNTISYRRRKGTLALLELLAANAAGWPARAVEFYRLLAWTQHLNHLRPDRAQTANLRKGDALELLDGPFDRMAHTVDLRRVVSQHSQGRFNIPSVGVFIWRLQVYSVSHCPAYCLEEAASNYFTFNVLGIDTPLYNRPQPETDPTHIAEPLNLPTPIRRRALVASPSGAGGSAQPQAKQEGRVRRAEKSAEASTAYYGEGKSLAIWAPDWPKKHEPQPIPAELIIPADLSNWRYRVPKGHVLVDPELGRIVFPPGPRQPQGVWVTYQYAFSADIGGGEYERPIAQPAGSVVYPVGRGQAFTRIADALEHWRADQLENPHLLAAVIEIVDSGVYTEHLRVYLREGESLQIRAANRTRPVLRLLDFMADQPDAFVISGEAGSRLVLDGLLIAGRGVQVVGIDVDALEPGALDPGELCDVTLRHCTLVPGWALHCDCEPRRPNEPSLELIHLRASVHISHSIIGTILVVANDGAADPIRLNISDSVVDATHSERVAIGAPGLPLAFAVVTLARCTVLGEVQTHAIELAENSIFFGQVQVGRRQHGCMRFCYVTPGSRTPRRYNCQPDLAERAATEAAAEAAGSSSAPLDPALIALTRDRVRPQFNSERYGTPTYCQLAMACAEEITRGADDESELGVFHDLYQPQREANLRARLEEFTPAGMEAGILFSS